MKTATLSGRTIALPIVAYDAANLSIDQLAEVRQHSIERFSASLRPQLLKHSDEQTLAAAVALDRAIAHMRADSHQDFSRWAVISATRYLGRTAFAAVIDKYQIDGPWGVSVQVIPHTSPHALASSLSLALASHGPCLGAGAAPANELEAIVTAATLLEQPEISGAWVVFSGWTDASPMDSEAGSSPHCQAAVLALLPRRAEAMVQPMGAIAIGQKPHRPAEMENSHPRADLLHWLAARHQRDPAFVELASGGMAIRIELTGGPACIKSPPHSEPRLAATSKRRRRLLAAGALTR